MKNKPVCQTLRPWLLANLGKRCLAPLTGTDARALDAAIHIVDLYSVERSEMALTAFRKVVLTMQPTTRELAYHAIAHVMDWSDRVTLWEEAGLSPFPTLRLCAGEPEARRAA